jgi:hypothetical protein
MSGTRGKPEDFADVFSKLVAAAPAPIGLAPGLTGAEPGSATRGACLPAALNATEPAT